MERRAFIKMVFGGGILGFLMGAGKAVSADEGLIRPPGAEPEELFLGTCARCGKCCRQSYEERTEEGFLACRRGIHFVYDRRV